MVSSSKALDSIASTRETQTRCSSSVCQRSRGRRAKYARRVRSRARKGFSEESTNDLESIGVGISNPRPQGPGTVPSYQDNAVPQVLDLGGRSLPGRWNAVHLAYLGDAVWELYVRAGYFCPPTKLTTYYESVQNKVRAEAQALFYEVLLSGPTLSSKERDILRWGHNAKVQAPKRFSNSGKHVDTYKQATALECLIGYLYLTEQSRLKEVVDYLMEIP